MLLLLASFKGGCAKTTTAIHVAAALASRPGRRVLLVDGDQNEGITHWRARASTPPAFEVVGEADGRRFLSGDHPYTDAVIDTMARPPVRALGEVAQASTWVIVPSPPDILSCEAAVLTVAALPADVHARVRVLLTVCPPPPSTDADAARNGLTAAGLRVLTTQIPRTVAHPAALEHGRTVADEPGPRAARAWATYLALVKELSQ